VLPAGKSLRTLREKLGLTMRDVETSSARVAERHRNEEFSIPPSRLSDIETKGILPSIYRLYTLSVIYRRDLRELLSWYGVDLNNMAADLGLVSPPKSHVSDALKGLASVQVPVRMDPGLDERRTTNLGRMVEQWGLVPLAYLAQFATTDFTYGYVGTQDFTMYPILPAGGHHSAAPPVISSAGSDPAPSTGGRSAGPSCGCGYEVNRVARPRFFAKWESASSTELRCVDAGESCRPSGSSSSNRPRKCSIYTSESIPKAREESSKSACSTASGLLRTPFKISP
jgi:transcriptional regulator with XRE-family HTH domain